MKVKTLESHTNVFGDSFDKSKDSIYDLPDDHANALIASGVVEECREKPLAESSLIIKK